MELEEIISKIDKGEKLTESEIKELLWSAKQTYEKEGEDHRWTRGVFTVVEVNGRYFGISWLRGLTECQEHEFWKQPYEVGCETELKTVAEQIWKPIADVKKTDNQLIVVKQLPLIEEHLKNVSLEIDKKVNEVKSLVCTEENKQAIKKIRTEMKKEFEEYEIQRKTVKEKVSAPYMKFEEVYKECISEKFKDADKELKNKIDLIENEQKKRLEDESKRYFEEYKTSEKVDFITFEKMNLKIGVSDNPTKLKKQIKEFIDKITDDLNLIETQEHKAEILVEYKQTLNVSNAITTVTNRFKAIEEEKKKQEELKQRLHNQISDEADKIVGITETDKELAKDFIDRAVERDNKDKFVIFPTKKEITIKFNLYDDQSKQLKKFLELSNIEYESEDL